MNEQQVLLLDLRDEPAAIAAYDAWHAPGAVPAAVIAGIRAAGIADMRIFRTGNRLVMLLDTTAAFDPVAKAERDAADPAIAAWEALMGELQVPIASAPSGERWTRAGCIFALDEHA